MAGWLWTARLEVTLPVKNKQSIPNTVLKDVRVMQLFVPSSRNILCLETLWQSSSVMGLWPLLLATQQRFMYPSLGDEKELNKELYPGRSPKSLGVSVWWILTMSGKPSVHKQERRRRVECCDASQLTLSGTGSEPLPPQPFSTLPLSAKSMFGQIQIQIPH